MNPFQKKISGLEVEIKKAAQSYYTSGDSGLTDDQFDKMVEQLKQLAPESEVLHQTGWGYDVNSDTTPGEKVKHKYGEAGSLDKAYSWDELFKEFKGAIVDASLKLDGISIVLYYQKGQLVQALTRGDGITGIDVTDKVRLILKDKTQITLGFTGAIRGEILMSYDNFEKFQEIHPDAKNPRNSTAGLINGQALEEMNYLNILVYSVVGSDNHNFGRGEMPVNRAFLLVEYGEDNVAPSTVISLDNPDSIQKLYDLRTKWYNKWPADGIVLTAMRPTWNPDTFYITYNSQAFKFPSEEGTSEVEEVIWRLTKSRYYMPKIRVKPVQLAGTTVQHCTCYNSKYLVDNNIGVGSVVAFSKHGEIIPNIDKVVTPTAADIPTTCPVCGTEFIWDGVHIKCPNESCGNAKMQDILMWTKTLAPVDGMGDILRKKFITDLFGEDVTVNDLMDGRLQKYATSQKSDSAQVNLFFEMCNKLCNSRYDLASALEALNIPRLGNLTAKKVAQIPDKVRHLIAAYQTGTITPSASIEQLVGPATAQSIADNADKFVRLALIQDRIDWEPKQQVDVKGKVAITGKLSVPRDQFVKELEAAGYKVASDVSKDTAFLITDSPDSQTSKNQKADKFGVTKITEADFRLKYM